MSGTPRGENIKTAGETAPALGCRLLFPMILPLMILSVSGLAPRGGTGKAQNH